MMFKMGGAGPSGSNMEHYDKKSEVELEDYAYDKGDEEFEQSLQKEEHEERLKTHSSIKIDRGMTRAFRAFRNAIPSIRHADPESLDIYLIATDEPLKNLEITRALRKGEAIPNFHVLTETRQEARSLSEKSGIEHVFKGNPSRKRLEHPVDIVAVLDEKAEISWRTLRNVERGGWLLIPLSRANIARAEGLRFMGVIEQDGAYPSVRREGPEFWQKKEVTSDEELRNAKQGDGVVSYQEAADAVEKAYGTKTNIVENYRRLIEEAKIQNPSWAAKELTELTCTIERKGAPIEILVKLTLPLKEEEHNKKNLAIFRKKLTN